MPLLANPAAASRIGSIRAAFESLGADLDYVPAPSAEALESEARRLVARGCERLIVAGGDGTIHLALQAVAATDTVLGVVPVGTGNDFAAAAGIPAELSLAAETALGDPSALDLLRVGGRWVASVVTFGFSADVNARANRMRWPRGSRRYTLATVLELPAMVARALDMSFDGSSRQLDAVLVSVANTPTFGGGMRISPGASPVDGVADVTIVGPVARLRLLRLLGKVFDGSHIELPEVETLTARIVSVDRPGVEIWGDGERITMSPATIEVVPRAVRIAGASATVPD